MQTTCLTILCKWLAGHGIRLVTKRQKLLITKKESHDRLWSLAVFGTKYQFSFYLIYIYKNINVYYSIFMLFGRRINFDSVNFRKKAKCKILITVVYFESLLQTKASRPKPHFF